jgi:hypothetical protein
MRRYVGKHRSAPVTLAITGLIGLGYVVRAAEHAVLRHRDRAREHWAYALGAFTGRATVGGRVVTDR